MKKIFVFTSAIIFASAIAMSPVCNLSGNTTVYASPEIVGPGGTAVIDDDDDISDAEYAQYTQIWQTKISQADELAKDKDFQAANNAINQYIQNNTNSIDFSNITDENDPKINQIEEWDKNNQLEVDENGDAVASTASEVNDSSKSGCAGNHINYSSFTNGDIILVHGILHGLPCLYGYYRHAGTYDQNRGSFISADHAGGTTFKVLYESKNFFRINYSEARGMFVRYGQLYSKSYLRLTRNIIAYLRNQLGKPYRLSSKSNENSWYCSKLPWAGWHKYSGVDIDNNKGYLCLPDDIYRSYYTTTFAFSNK